MIDDTVQLVSRSSVLFADAVYYNRTIVASIIDCGEQCYYPIIVVKVIIFPEVFCTHADS